MDVRYVTCLLRLLPLVPEYTEVMIQFASDIGAVVGPWVLRVVTVIGLGLAAIIGTTRGQQQGSGYVLTIVSPIHSLFC